MNFQTLPPVVLSWLVNLLVALVAASAPFAAVALVKLIKAKEAEIQASAANHSGAQAFYLLESAASLAVKGAEQYFGSGQGKAKKEAAVAVVQSLLESHGVTSVDVSAVESAVEAAVFTEINSSTSKPATATPTDTPAQAATAATPAG